MDFRKVVFGATGSLRDGDVFKRSDLFNYIVSMGYSERTAINELTPSRKGSAINIALQSGAIEKHGPLGYRIIDAERVGAKPERKKFVRQYAGSPREGWQDISTVSDPDVHGVHWRMCGEEYENGFNLKIYADGVVDHKANYWLRFSDGKISGPDVSTLKTHHPDIYANALEDMRDYVKNERME